MKRLAVIPIVLCGSLVLSACGMHLGLSKLVGSSGGTSSTPAADSVKATHTPPANPNAVSIINAKYRPKNLTVKLGTTLTWTNTDDAPQSVTSDVPGVFDSGALSTGATWSYTFSTAGVFPYHSTGSSTTFGSVTVTP
jgi:plastocyanin